MSFFSQPILALDTAVGAAACLYMPNQDIFTASMHTPRAHSRELLPLLAGLLEQQGLEWHDIGAFAVGVGPGSFTGLRVACATVAGLNASLKRPVYGLCSLSLGARQASSPHAVWSIEDARSGLVYAARYQGEKTINAATCMTWDAFKSMDAADYITNSPVPVDLHGWNALPLQQSRKQALAAAVKALSPSATVNTWAEPVYLQPSQAEKTQHLQQKRKSR